MATSPNYGWAEPDNSSLVKNGAADIRTLGDSIDSSLWAVGYGQAGKNKIINGDFAINQRNFTSNTASGSYNFDRFVQQNGGASGTLTITPQTFTAGSAPVAGYEARNFVQCVTAAGAAADTFAVFTQKIEDVRNLAGQTVTISFWAKANSGTPKIAVELEQYFGTGGSPSTTVNNYAGQVTLSTSWVRQSVTFSVPSLSGKTVGTDANSSSINLNLWLSGGSTFNSRTGSIGLQNNTFQIWGVQVEYGSKATPFQTASETVQGELALCQRYYVRFTCEAGAPYAVFAFAGLTESTTTAVCYTTLPVQIRSYPASVEYGGSLLVQSTGTSATVTSISLQDRTNNKIVSITYNVASGLVAGLLTYVRANNSSTAYIGISAEL
jgi:hypothetical protein